MSTMVLTKDGKHGKKGAVVTVPFMEARDLERGGLAARWNGGKGPAVQAASAGEEAHAAELAALKEAHAVELSKLRADLEAAQKLLAEQSKASKASK